MKTSQLAIFILIISGALSFGGCSSDNTKEDITDSTVYEDTSLPDTGSGKCFKKSDCKSGMYCDKENNVCVKG
ncbi:MAG: hypothetical protein N3B13_11440, partial [Deltaproteobacteria bacterium]|nr:hypothetical protein [Deltaproteobacteria bacterium]